MTFFELGFRVSAVALLVLVMLVWLRHLRLQLTGLLGAIFFFCVISYLMCPPLDRYWDFGIFEIPFFVGCFGAAPAFWLFSRAIFDDRFSIRRWHGGVLLVMEILGFGHRYASTREGLGGIVWSDPSVYLFVHQIMSLAITLSALSLALSGWRDDLVETRRRFRLILVAIVGGYILAVVVTEIYLRAEPATSFVETVNVALIFLLVFGFTFALVQLRSELLPVVSKNRTAVSAESSDRALDEMLALLTHAMEHDFAYREEGLTISRLANKLQAQEYLLRRLINRRLGFRNFNEFLNSYRIREVCGKLEDPAFAQLPILTIAMDCGYSSLGPFNRSFKEITGQTPKEYRAEKALKSKS